MVIKAKEEAALSDARTLQSYCASSPFAPPPKGAARPRPSALASRTPVARRTRAARAARASQNDPEPTELPAAVGAPAGKPGAANAGAGHKRKSLESEATNWVDGEAEAKRSATRQRLAA